MDGNHHFVLNGFKSDLYFSVNGEKAAFYPTVFRFSGGELQIKIPYEDLEGIPISSVEVFTRLQDAEGILALLLFSNALKMALRDFHGVYYTLNIGYFPYARQDRVCAKGEAFSALTMANLINSMFYDHVTVTDPHSDVTPALINNVSVIDIADIFVNNKTLSDLLNWSVDALVIPDAGAAKKVNYLACKFEMETVQCHKIRDPTYGTITSSSFQGDVEGKDLLIVDDIADGGRTFIYLAKLLKEGGAKSVSLYVTHGIFSQGLDPVLEYIDHIYTTDTFINGLYSNKLTTICL